MLHQYFNAYVGNKIADTTFKLLTYLGDGYFTLILVILFLFFNIKKSLLILVSYVFSGGLAQALKFSLFSDSLRPYYYYSYRGLKLNLVDGVDMHIHNSFPSGHSTAAFSLFMCLCFFSENRLIKISSFIIALCVAFSRVYLSQHFFEDIYAGSIIGVCTAGICYYILFYSATSNKLENINRPIHYFFSKKNA